MKKILISIIAALVAFLSFCFLFTGSPDNAGLYASIDPVNAVKGLSFALSFGAGMPATAAVISAVALFVLVPVTVFLVTHRLLRRYYG